MNIYDASMIKAQKLSFVWRMILCLIFPPLAVFDKGCFPVALVYLLTALGTGTGVVFGFAFISFLWGWIPAGLVALLICGATEKDDDDRKDDDVIEVVEDEQIVPMKLTTKEVILLIIRYCLCFLCPPLAVLDKGCGASIYVFFFTLFGLIPGVILALLICFRSNDYYRRPVKRDAA